MTFMLPGPYGYEPDSGGVDGPRSSRYRWSSHGPRRYPGPHQPWRRRPDSRKIAPTITKREDQESRAGAVTPTVVVDDDPAAHRLGAGHDDLFGLAFAELVGGHADGDQGGGREQADAHSDQPVSTHFVVLSCWMPEPPATFTVDVSCEVRVNARRGCDEHAARLTLVAMPIEVSVLLSPSRTAIVTSEVQNGVVGEPSALPALAEEARASMLPNLARLLPVARAAGVQVVHCTAFRRADGKGANSNARLFAGVRKSPVALLPGTERGRRGAGARSGARRPRAHPHARAQSDGRHGPRPGSPEPRASARSW